MHFDSEQQYSLLYRDLSVSTSFYKHVLCRPANKKSVIFRLCQYSQGPEYFLIFSLNVFTYFDYIILVIPLVLFCHWQKNTICHFPLIK